MYLRYDEDGTPIFVPEDGPKRDWVPVENVRAVDPPSRRVGVRMLPAHKRATELILQYLTRRVEIGAKGEAASCRGFLKAYHTVTADGNESGIELAIMRADRNAVQFYFHIHGVGPVVWLPVLVTAANNHTNDIMRETGPDRLSFAPPATPAADDDDEPRRRRIPPKTETVLLRGKQV